MKREKVPIIQIGCRFQDEQMIIGSELFFSFFFLFFFIFSALWLFKNKAGQTHRVRSKRGTKKSNDGKKAKVMIDR